MRHFNIILQSASFFQLYILYIFHFLHIMFHPLHTVCFELYLWHCDTCAVEICIMKLMRYCRNFSYNHFKVDSNQKLQNTCNTAMSYDLCFRIVAHLASDLLKLPFTSTLKMEAAGSSKTLVPMYQTTWCHIPEDCNLDITAIETPISHTN
jgi:hypothetical protein